MISLLKRIYFGIGIHAAPPGTLLGRINRLCLELARLPKRTLRRLARPGESRAKVLRVAIYEGGGLGDALIQMIYLPRIKQLIGEDPVRLDFYARAAGAFHDLPFVDGVYRFADLQRSEYDVVIECHRVYVVRHLDSAKAGRLAPRLLEFCRRTQAYNAATFGDEYHDNLINQLAYLNGKNRVAQIDLAGLFDVDQGSPAFLSWPAEAHDVLARHDLRPGTYLTVGRGVDELFDGTHPKMWPLEHYARLVTQLKADHPHLRIVQIGKDPAHGRIAGVDLDLVGRTTLPECFVVLKHSVLHVDGEGGLVHAKRHAQGRSVVIFGPTNPAVFGYAQNANVHRSACPSYCESVTASWNQKCLRGFTEPPCIHAVTPAAVARAVSRRLPKPGARRAASVTRGEPARPTAARVAWVGDDGARVPARLGGVAALTVFARTFGSAEHSRGYVARPGVTQIYASPFNIPAADASFDEVHAEHPPRPAFVVRELLRVTKPSGRVVVKLGATEAGAVLDDLEMTTAGFADEDGWLVIEGPTS